MDSLKRKELHSVLRRLLASGFAGTQEDICNVLEKHGFDVNQSTVSRLLRRLEAVKSTEGGKVVYRLPERRTSSDLSGSLDSLVIEIASNEAMVVIRTIPGSAMFVGHFLDAANMQKILGTVAGDDTIFITPKSIKEIKALEDEIREMVKST
ncbi:MAG: arginine repressor [Pseudomonadota bacterium]